MDDLTLQTIYDHIDASQILRLRVGTQLAFYGRVDNQPFTIGLNYHYTSKDRTFDEKFGFLLEAPLHMLEETIDKPRNSQYGTLAYIEPTTAQKIISGHFRLTSDPSDFSYTLESMVAKIHAPQRIITLGIADDESVATKIIKYQNGNKEFDEIPLEQFLR